jgi:hypothetical protein
MVRLDTILRWYRKLIVRKYDHSKDGRAPGWSRIDQEIEALILYMAKENLGWGLGPNCERFGQSWP